MPNRSPKVGRKTFMARFVGAMVPFFSRVAGETSRLRRSVSIWEDRRVTGRLTRRYQLGSSRVDYALARALYENSHDEYKLGAWAARPVINTTVGFMGVPRFRSEDEDAQHVLDDFFGQNVSRMQQTHRDALRDGDCWVWITREGEDEQALYPEEDGVRLVYNIIPPEQVTHIDRDPWTGKPTRYILTSDHVWLDESDSLRRARVIQQISAQSRIIRVEGDGVPPGIEEGEEENPWGFLPIVQFSNERDASAANGRSDLEPIEPFMKAYHDVMLHAIQGSKLHSTPRLKLHLEDVGAFLRNNFGIDDPATFVAEGGTINLDGHELLFFQGEEDASFIEVRSAIGSAEPLLKFLFYAIVEVSETPEFAFGAHVPASLASVKEQMPILIRRISRKREHFAESWQRLARIVLAMTAKAAGRSFSTYATTLLWDDIDPRDKKEIAEELYTVVQALSMALQNALIGQEAAVNFLARYIDTMNEYVSDDPELPGEREAIMRSRILLARLEDAELAERERELINEALSRIKIGRNGEAEAGEG